MNPVHRCLAVLLLSGLAVAGCATRPAGAPRGCDIAERYIEASNTGDAERVAGFLADDVAAVFLSVGGEAQLTRGKPAVIEAIETYTAQCPTCRSSMQCLHADHDAVYVIEHVVFVDQDGVERRQSAPLIVELEDGLIRKIVYYPASASPGGASR